MLKRIKLKNFRSIKDEIELELAQITIFVGGNSCGKTTIIEAIEYLKDCCESNFQRIAQKAVEFSYRDTNTYPSNYIDVNYRENVITCGGTFIINDIHGFLARHRELSESITRSTWNGDLNLWKILESLQKRELTVTFDGVGKRLSLMVDDNLLLSVDSEDYFWDGASRVLSARHPDFDDEDDIYEVEHMRGGLIIGKIPQMEEIAYWYQDRLDGLENPSRFMAALRCELTQNFRIFGITSDTNGLPSEEITCNIPRVHLPFEFRKKQFDQRHFDTSIRSYEGGSAEPEMTKDFEFLSYVRLANEIVEPISLLVRALLACMHEDLDVPRVRDSRSQLKNLTLRTPLSDIEEQLWWSYGESLVETGSHRYYLGRKLRSFLKKQQHLGSYEVVSFKTEGRIVAKSTKLPESQRVEKTLSFFLKDKSGVFFDFSQVGSGVSFIFPIFCAIGGVHRSSFSDHLISIQQPELHLHPAAQAELGDLLLWFSRNNGRAIVETHSEHLILRILRRIRQSFFGSTSSNNAACSNDVLIYSFAKEGRNTKITRIRVGRNGDFMDPWPGGFFPEREQELFDE